MHEDDLHQNVKGERADVKDISKWAARFFFSLLFLPSKIQATGAGAITYSFSCHELVLSGTGPNITNSGIFSNGNVSLVFSIQMYSRRKGKSIESEEHSLFI